MTSVLPIFEMHDHIILITYSFFVPFVLNRMAGGLETIPGNSWDTPRMGCQSMTDNIKEHLIYYIFKWATRTGIES